MTYKNLLNQISNAAVNTNTVIEVPSNKYLYEVDLITRTIQGPEMISVQGEHYAETIYFLVDRFYDNMDLAQTNCVIHYVINDKSYVYAVPFCDIKTYDGKIIIPWAISMSATQAAGTIRYFIHFYLLDNIIDDNEHLEYTYSLNTRPTSSRIVQTLSEEELNFIEEDQELNLPSYYEELLNTLDQKVNTAATFWLDI